MYRTSGIPVATAPRSVRDVNPYMCTMKPLRDGAPYHGQIVTDQGPEGFRCCCKNDDQNVRTMKPFREEAPFQGQIVMDQGLGVCRCCGEKDGPYTRPTKPLREGQSCRGQILTEQVPEGSRCCCKKDKKVDKALLEWEHRRRQNFINKCCDGLLATPCCSVGSCSEVMNDMREPAEFFVQCDCSKDRRDKKTPKRKNGKRKVVQKKEKDNGKPRKSACLCFDQRLPIQAAPRRDDSCSTRCGLCAEDAIRPPRHREDEIPSPKKNPPPDLSDLVVQLKCLVWELRAQRKYSERCFGDYRR